MNKQKTSLWLQTLFPSLSLFTSLGTLVCCALPALLVTLGMGASLASLISFFPWITIISDFKLIIFVISGSLIFLAFPMFPGFILKQLAPLSAASIALL